jgi:hypothetical protein
MRDANDPVPAGSPDMEPKRRKLDELFADEPYLSTTMKARRLHEKLQEFEARDHTALPVQAFVSIPPALAEREIVERQVIEARPAYVPEKARLSFAQAAELLRESPSQLRARALQGLMDAETADRLIRLREQVLMQWMAEGLPRSADGEPPIRREP